MNPKSVAGPDGFTSYFFQICWDIVGFDLFEACCEFMTGVSKPKSFIATSIVLIPKT